MEEQLSFQHCCFPGSLALTKAGGELLSPGDPPLLLLLPWEVLSNTVVWLGFFMGLAQQALTAPKDFGTSAGLTGRDPVQGGCPFLYTFVNKEQHFGT